MAITTAKYPYADKASWGAALVEALEATGMYDTVTYTASDPPVISISSGGTEYCKITGNTGAPSAVVKSDHISDNAFSGAVGYQNASYTHITKNSKSVMVTFCTNWRGSIIFTKTKGGTNLIALMGMIGNDARPLIIPADATAVESIAGPTLAPYSNTLPVAALTSPIGQSLSEGYTAPADVFVFARRPSSIIIAYTAGTNDLYRITVDGTEYITDGWFCLRDE